MFLKSNSDVLTILLSIVSNESVADEVCQRVPVSDFIVQMLAADTIEVTVL